MISPILAGVRALSGDKIQNFLASELRDRISRSGVRIRILDHASRRELIVEPRKFKGRLIHQLPEIRCPFGDVYLELYFAEPSQESNISLFKQGTRVLPDISRLDHFSGSPWNSRSIEGIIDVPFLQLTPGTRDGIVLDEPYESLCVALEPLEATLSELLDEKRRAEEEEASKQILSRVTRAFREAFLHLPSEEYGWLAAKTRDPRRQSSQTGTGEFGPDDEHSDVGLQDDTSFGEYLPEPLEPVEAQKSFFDYAGPMHKLMISPASSVMGVGERKKLKAVARDRSGRMIETGLSYQWQVTDGGGMIEGIEAAYAEYVAPEEPGVVSIELTVTQGDEQRVANALVTVTAELLKRQGGTGGATRRGLPGYTYRKAPGELWRSTYDAEQSIIFINNAHADFIYASRQPMTKLRYIMRLFAKELVLANFPEANRDELLERMVELTLYTEENLR